MVIPEALCTLSFCGHFLSVTADEEQTTEAQRSRHARALCTLSFCGHFLSVTAEEEQTTEAQRSQKGWSCPRLCAL